MSIKYQLRQRVSEAVTAKLQAAKAFDNGNAPSDWRRERAAAEQLGFAVMQADKHGVCVRDLLTSEAMPRKGIH